jgi:hypothetical protein
MFNDPVSSPVRPKYFVRESTNLVGQALKKLEIVDLSKWLHVYPHPWEPTRLSLVKNAYDSNYWYAFMYDIFLDGKLSRWGDGISNVLLFLVKSDILKLMRIGIDLVPLMPNKFVFACLPCLWKTSLDKDSCRCKLMLSKKSAYHPKSAPLFVSDIFVQMRNPIFMVKDNTFNWETGTILVVDLRTPFNSLHFFASKFLLGLCPECLYKQVSKSLLVAAVRTRLSSEAHVLLFQMSDHQEGILLYNRYALTKPCKDTWRHALYRVCN